VVAVDCPHHITQRGNDRRAVFESDSDRLAYLALLGEHARVQHLRILGYCLMPNHVHLIALPERPDSMAKALRETHGRYAAYLNSRLSRSGHLWQGRYYSCPLDNAHLWNALRYTERNPVRAGMAADAESYAWSSAALHCAGAQSDGLVDLKTWRERWTPEAWRDFLTRPDGATADDAIRRFTHTGRPLGSAEFVRKLERAAGRPLGVQKGGRPKGRVIRRTIRIVENQVTVTGFF
jgi:putative transposase